MQVFIFLLIVLSQENHKECLFSPTNICFNRDLQDLKKLVSAVTVTQLVWIIAILLDAAYNCTNYLLFKLSFFKLLFIVFYFYIECFPGPVHNCQILYKKKFLSSLLLSCTHYFLLPKIQGLLINNWSTT
jgi:hypothetical protein